jgi:hypothetical protein
MPSSPSGLKPSATKVCEAAMTAGWATTMSQSMTGLAASPGTAVLPTCSIAVTGTPAAAMAPAYSSRSDSNRRGQLRSYSTTTITIDTLRGRS